jgi:hypothetical protein
MSNKELEQLVFEEAWHDLAIQDERQNAPVGEMQRRFPDEYKAARDLALGLTGATLSFALSKRQAETISEMIHSEDEGLSSIQEILKMQPVNALTLTHLVRLERKRHAKIGAETRHDKLGGSRDKQKQIRTIWATGKYTSRDKCAIEECEGLGMSYDAARKALRNTPDPPSCCK